MAKWKGKQVAFDIEDEEEHHLHEFAKKIKFTPIMKACLRLIKRGTLKASFSEDGAIQITWNDVRESQPQIQIVETPRTIEPDTNTIQSTQSNVNEDEFCL